MELVNTAIITVVRPQKQGFNVMSVLVGIVFYRRIGLGIPSDLVMHVITVVL